MKYALFLFLSGCAIMPDAYQAVGKHEELKKLCDEKDDAKACYWYGTYLRDSGDKGQKRVHYYKKSCDKRSPEGCGMYRKYLAQTTSTPDILKLCEQEDFQNCYQGGYVAQERGDLKEAQSLFSSACKIQWESTACQLKGKVFTDESSKSEKK